VYVLNSATGTIYIRNTGSIVSTGGGGYAVWTPSDATVILENAGALIGTSSFTVQFGSSDDIFVVRNGSSTNGVVDGFSGTNTLYYGLWTGTGVTVALEGSASGMAGNTRFQNAYGSAQGDSITGTSDTNVLVGLDGDDTLSGGAGDDTLWGADGRDTLLGGDDADLFYGGAGADSMVGGAGDDTYQVTETGDIVTENAAEGTDAVFTTVSWTVTSGNIEGVYAVGGGITITGSGMADVLVADAGGSTLIGGGGDDTLFGQGGADVLGGGGGSDVMRAGGGADTLQGGAGNDQLVGGTGADVFVYDAPGWGYDQIFDFLPGSDRLDLRGSGVGSISALTIYAVGGSTVVMLDTARIDLYGVPSLSASDFIFS